MTRFTAIIAGAALAAAVASPALAADDAATTKGREVFAAQRCSMCHAIDGKGNKNSPLDGVGGRLSPDQIRKWIVSPREMKSDTKMKAYPSLAPADIDALVAYLSSLKKQPA